LRANCSKKAGDSSLPQERNPTWLLPPLILNEWVGVKVTWTVRLADRSDGLMLRERGNHDSQLARKRGGAGPGCTDSNLSPLPHSHNSDFSLDFMTAELYPSHQKKKQIQN